MARYRSLDSRVIDRGSIQRYVYSPSTYTRYYDALVGTWKNITDIEDGWDKDNPLTINIRSSEYSKCSGEHKLSDGRIQTIVNNFVVDGIRTAAHPNAVTIEPDLDWAELAWSARQKLDPQRSDFSLPQFIGEAGDLPSLLTSIPSLLFWRGRAVAKRLGRKTRPRPRKLAPNAKPPSVMAAAAAAARQTGADVGSQYVGAQFGWKPVMQDLMAMLELQASIAQRLDWLLRLANGLSIKRRMYLPNLFESAHGAVTLLQSNAFFVKGQAVENSRVDHWVTARWGATPFFTNSVLPEHNDPDGLIFMAARLATGMNAKGLWEAWWELLPWSWLIDWWHNIGRLMSALCPGPLFLNLESLCYCCTARIQRFYIITEKPSWLTFSGGPDVLCHTTKTRKDLKPFLGIEAMRGPTIGFPDLNPGQWAILSGLLAQKVLG